MDVYNECFLETSAKSGEAAVRSLVAHNTGSFRAWLNFSRRKAYLAQVGCVGFGSDELRQTKGRRVSVSCILTSRFIETLNPN